MATKSSIKAAEAMIRLEPIYQGKFSRNIRYFADETLTHLQIQALFLLRDCGPLAMHQISVRLHMSKQHLTRFIDTLVRRGILERFQMENNRRTVYIRITPEGEKLLDDYIRYAVDTFATMVDSLTEEEKNNITNAANVLLDVISKVDDREI